jgi:molybdopterin-dependent oxidoreductase alpha subunit
VLIKLQQQTAGKGDLVPLTFHGGPKLDRHALAVDEWCARANRYLALGLGGVPPIRPDRLAANVGIFKDVGTVRSPFGEQLCDRLVVGLLPRQAIALNPLTGFHIDFLPDCSGGYLEAQTKSPPRPEAAFTRAARTGSPVSSKPMRRVKTGGGFPAIWYTLRKARQVGGSLKLYRALRSKNACKTCALGMGGQLGGMVNETGHFPEVCKKSIQAMTADMQGAIPEGFFEHFDLAALKGFPSKDLEAAGRITQPLYAGPLDNRYRTITWKEAMTRVRKKLAATPPERSVFYFSGRSSNEAGFLLQLLARMYGTNNVNNCSFYCHQASGVGLHSVTGSGTATVVLEDIESLGAGDVVMIIGANPASNHPRLMTTLMHFKRRGGKVVIVNPLKETGLVRFKVPSNLRSMVFGSQIADEYVQPHIGGDIAFLSGVSKAVSAQGAVDEAFVANHAEGWDGFLTHIESIDWGDIEKRSGVARGTIERIAALYSAAPSAVFCWAMGITHHEHGVENVQAIANLAMMRGMLGRPGAGLLPLRGHSNVQGMGSMGVTPKLKAEIFNRLEEAFGVELPTTPGLDTLNSIFRAADGDIDFTLCLGGNLYGSNPDSSFASHALGSIGMVVYMSTTLNTGHAWGRGKETLILPVLARDEEPQATTQESMFNYVRLSDGGEARHKGPRSEVEVIADIGSRVLGNTGPIDWEAMRLHRDIRKAIARIIPGYEKIGEIDVTKQEFQIEGRTLHEPRFSTDSGRARFHNVEIPQLRGVNGELRLMTVRSEGQFNTVVYEDEDLYRGQDRRDVIMLSREDIERMGLVLDQKVTVRSDTGDLPNVMVREVDIRPGNVVMYYPEANVLVPKVADPRSRTPAFKSTIITIETQDQILAVR